jgi:Cu2+-exporting ATPase
MDCDDHAGDGGSDPSATCSLCSLPIPGRPVTGATVDGTFCCRGCLDVARTLETVAESPTASPADDGRSGDGRVVGRVWGRRIAVATLVLLLVAAIVVGFV